MVKSYYLLEDIMKAVVIFWSGTGNTENMAEGIADGVRSQGIETEVYRVKI
jgi:flavodoxin